MLCLRGLFHDFSSNFFCLPVQKHFVEEPFCAVFQKISGSKKSLRRRRREKYQDFGSKIYCLTVPRTFVGEHLEMSLISGIKKFYAYEGYLTIFLRTFLSHGTETFRRGTLLCCVSESLC